MIFDRLKAAVALALEALTPRIDYTAVYGAAIIADNGDGTVEVRCDDPRIGDMSNVPVRLGLPGVRLTMKKLARVELGFAGASPKAPFVSLFDGGSFEEIVFVGEGGSPKSVARVGDIAVAPWPMAMITATIATGGGPVPLTGSVSFDAPLVGVIARGSGVTKA